MAEHPANFSRGRHQSSRHFHCSRRALHCTVAPIVPIQYPERTCPQAPFALIFWESGAPLRCFFKQIYYLSVGFMSTILPRAGNLFRYMFFAIITVSSLLVTGCEITPQANAASQEAAEASDASSIEPFSAFLLPLPTLCFKPAQPCNSLPPSEVLRLKKSNGSRAEFLEGTASGAPFLPGDFMRRRNRSLRLRKKSPLRPGAGLFLDDLPVRP